MSTVFKIGFSAGALAIASAFPALADISTQELKSEILSLYESVGYQVDIGSETMSGDTLSLDNVSMQFNLPEEAGQISMVYEWVEMTEIDGEVEISFAPRLDIRALISPPGEDEVDLQAHFDLNELNALVSGQMDALKVAASAAGGEFKIDSLIVDGEAAPLNVTMGMGSLISNYNIVKKADDRRRISGDSELASFDINANMQEPDGDGFFTMVGGMTDMTSVFSIEMAKFVDPMQFLADGFSGDGSMEIGSSNMDVNFQDGRDRFAMTSETNGGRFGFAMSNTAIGYDVVSRGAKLNMSSSELPIPAINLGYDEVSFSFNLPLAPGSGPSDFHVGTAVRGLTISEAIWSMFDPSQGIPRDPATIAVNVSGKLMVLANLLDPEVMENLNGPPFLPESIELNELTAAIGGALLTGTGSATFDFSNPNTIEGIPAPKAEVTLNLKGGFGLMDKLVAIGLIPEDASMGVRAMMGAFARQVGDDELETLIEVTEEGAVLANGQRIQ